MSALGWRFVWSRREDIFSDDAYYYTLVARNLAQSGAFTFDGVNQTNGFHPLWLFLQVGLAFLLPDDASPRVFYDALVLTSAAVLALLIGCAAWIGAGLQRKPEQEPLALALVAAVGVCFWPPFLSTAFNGMESVLVLPLGVALVVLIAVGRFWSAGVVGGMLVAARLDTVVYVLGPLALWYAAEAAVRGRRLAQAAGRAMALLTPAALLVLAYMAFNFAIFGHPMPISGALKSTFPEVNLQWHQLIQGPLGLSELLQNPVFFALLTGCSALALSLWKRPLDRRLGSLSMATGMATLTQVVSFLLFQRWAKQVPGWYLTLPIFTGVMALASGLACRMRPETTRKLAWGLGILLLALNAKSLGGASRYAIRNPGFHTQMDEVVAFMRERGPARWASTDCGKIAFWSMQPVLNLDGLINGWDYQTRLGRGELGRYLADLEVRYLVTTVWNGPQRIPEPMYAARVAPDVYEGRYSTYRFWVHSYVHAVDSDVIELPKDAEVFRSAPAPDHGPMARSVIFDLWRVP